MFITTHNVSDEVIDKHGFLWIEEKMKKFEVDLKTKNVLVMSLKENQFRYVLNYNSIKEMWGILEMIYGVSPSIKQKVMNT